METLRKLPLRREKRSTNFSDDISSIFMVHLLFKSQDKKTGLDGKQWNTTTQEIVALRRLFFFCFGVTRDL